MTGDEKAFINLTKKKGGNVCFGGNQKGKIIGSGTIGSTLKIEDVALVEGLKYNLLSVAQLCDKGRKVTFDSEGCTITDCKTNKPILYASRTQNVYSVNIKNEKEVCLVSKENESWLWHRRLGHVSMNLLSKLAKQELVVGLPKAAFEKDHLCTACQLGKQHKKPFPSINYIPSKRILELLHMDLFGPVKPKTLGGKEFTLVIVDDYSRYTWVHFLTHKNEAFDCFIKTTTKVEVEKGMSISRIRSDNGTAFKNKKFIEFCEYKGIEHNFSAPYTPQQNGVVERKNRTLAEMARTMLSENNIPGYFWGEAINTACYIINRALIWKT